jgi:hypothetical protein
MSSMLAPLYRRSPRGSNSSASGGAGQTMLNRVIPRSSQTTCSIVAPDRVFVELDDRQRSANKILSDCGVFLREEPPSENAAGSDLEALKTTDDQGMKR